MHSCSTATYDGKKRREKLKRKKKKLSQQQENTSIDERSEQNIKQKHKKKLIFDGKREKPAQRNKSRFHFAQVIVVVLHQ